MTNVERLCGDLEKLGLGVKSLDHETPVGVEFHPESDFDHVLKTLRANGYKIIRYVDVSRYVVLMPSS